MPRPTTVNATICMWRRDNCEAVETMNVRVVTAGFSFLFKMFKYLGKYDFFDKFWESVFVCVVRFILERPAFLHHRTPRCHRLSRIEGAGIEPSCSMILIALMDVPQLPMMAWVFVECWCPAIYAWCGYVDMQWHWPFHWPSRQSGLPSEFWTENVASTLRPMTASPPILTPAQPGSEILMVPATGTAVQLSCFILYHLMFWVPY